MATYLLTWNPNRWNWKSLSQDIETVKRTGKKRDSWSVGITKKIVPGDRIFLIKLGEAPKGIIASGWVQSKVFSDKHWDKNSENRKKLGLYVLVDFDTILEDDQVFPLEELKRGNFAQVRWTPQASGQSIPEKVAIELEQVWANFNNQPNPIEDIVLPEEVGNTQTFTEGAIRQVTINAYERNSGARSICVKHYGFRCGVCGFDFRDFYGKIGESYIHVHHLKSLSEIGEAYDLDPIKDLRPVCPNCHAMLHKRRPILYTIEELKKIIGKSN